MSNLQPLRYPTASQLRPPVDSRPAPYMVRSFVLEMEFCAMLFVTNDDAIQRLVRFFSLLAKPSNSQARPAEWDAKPTTAPVSACKCCTLLWLDFGMLWTPCQCDQMTRGIHVHLCHGGIRVVPSLFVLSTYFSCYCGHWMFP